MPAPRFVLDEFWPSDLFLGGIPGAWYDPTDLSTMFQDSTGLTPVTAVEQPVGLIFDKSQGTPTARYNLLRYSEQFDDAAWTKANITVATNSTTAPDGTTTADTYTVTATAAAISYQDAVVSGSVITYSIYAKQNSGATDANTFAVYNNTTATNLSIFTINYATGAISHSVGSGASAIAVGNGWWRLSVTHSSGVSAGNSIRVYPCFTGNPENAGESAFIWGAQLQTGSTATTYQKITSGTGGEWTPGNHASQSTAASRPTYRARYNLLTQSEDFGNAAWSKTTVPCTITVDQTTAPDGTNTADLMTASATAFSGVVRNDARVSAVVTYTASCYFKAGNVTIGRLTLATSLLTNGIGCDFTLTGAGAAGAPATFGAGWVAGAATIASVGNGWYRCTLTGTAPATTDLTTVVGHRGACSAGDTLFIWGAQVMTAADVTATGNAYQRIAAATVYDTAPIFRPYLAFDGLDDSLSTAAINFSTTDKVSVFLGVSRMAEAAFGVILECRNPLGFPSFAIFSPVGPNYQFRSFGTIDSNQIASGYAAPITNTVTMLGDIGAPLLGARINAVQVLNNINTQGTGTYANASMFIGRRDTGASPFNGRYYEIIVRGAASSVTEIADAELWVNARTGAF